MKKIILMLSFACAGLVITSCGSTKTEEAEVKELEVVADTENAYICPMRCENSGSMTMGKCPVCQMDLYKNPDFKGELPAESNDQDATSSDKMHSHSEGDHSDHKH
jgi:hypothetical protein